MKCSNLFVGGCAALALGFAGAAQASTILTPVSDANLARNLPPAVADGGGSLTNTATDGLFVNRDPSNGGDVSTYNAVYVFQLPDVGAISDPFTAATFSVALIDNGVTGASFAAEVYGLGRRASSTILGSDYYRTGNGTVDATDATLIDGAFAVWGSGLGSGSLPPLGVTTTPDNTGGNGTQALIDYLNAQYEDGAGAGEFVFIRLSPDGSNSSVGGGLARGSVFASLEDPEEANRPFLDVTVIPEPATLGLMGLGALLMVRRRR